MTPNDKLPIFSTHFFNNSKIAAVLFSGIALENGGEYHIPTIPRKGIEITLVVSIDSQKKLNTIALGPYEASVLDAIFQRHFDRAAAAGCGYAGL